MLSSFSPMTNLGHDKRALLIGINRYRAAPPLRGAVNDARLMSEILQRPCDFAAEDIRTLVDADATASAIRSGLAWIAATATPDTSVLLHFSGWSVGVPRDPSGSLLKVWDRASRSSGPRGGGSTEAPPEAWPGTPSPPSSGHPPGLPGSREMALLPFDWSESDPASTIRRSELIEWLATLPTHDVTIVMDAPYSGTLLGEAPAGGGIVYLGACREEEICFELGTEDGVFHGGLTYFLSQAILRSPAGTTYRQLFEQVSAGVTSRFPAQHPQIEGDLDRVAFGTSAWPGAQAVRITGRDAEGVTLNRGAAAGVTLRSWWAVYPEHGEDGPEAEPLGMVEITGVNVSDARARVLSEVVEGLIEKGARAVEKEHDFGEMRLVVGIDAQESAGGATLAEQALMGALAKVELLRIARREERRDVLVWLAPSGTSLDLGPSGEMTVLSEPSWIIEDDPGTTPDGSTGQSRPLFLPCRASRPYDVRLALEKLARYRNMLALVNPNPKSALAGKVTFDLKRQGADGEWVIVEADRRTGLPVLHEGDMLRLEISNQHERDIYVSVFDFGVSMSIGTLTESYPSGVQIPAGDTRTDLEGIELYVPKTVPGPAGTETFKLFATVYPMNLGSMLLEQGGRSIQRNRGGSSTELWQLVDMAVTGRGTRERRPVALPPDHEWTTVQRSFELRRERRQG